MTTVFTTAAHTVVMAALDAAIQEKARQFKDSMDGRVKPSHDRGGLIISACAAMTAASLRGDAGTFEREV
ncbi:MAG: hypothetical protein ACLPPF_08005 [Rhodomicrobium sp.]